MSHNDANSQARVNYKSTDAELSDVRNNLYLSDNGQEILKFYGSFGSVAELVSWMRNRPKSVAKGL